MKLFEADPILGENVLCNPKNAIPKCDQDLIKAQEIILDELSDEKKLILSIKNNIKARFYGLPVCPELHRTTVPKNDDLGCFIKFTG